MQRLDYSLCISICIIGMGILKKMIINSESNAYEFSKVFMSN